MRLTLRTLLAYRDGILPQNVRDDFRQRLQQNHQVAALLKRIDDLVQRGDVPSPKVDLDGLGDANVIAEYLDNVLTSNKVAELERLCLQHPDHLCELAHCHELLAGAINSHVEVPGSLRSIAHSLADAKPRPSMSEQHASKSADIRTSQESFDTPIEINFQSPIVQAGTSAMNQAGLNLENNHFPEYLLTSPRKRWQIPVAIGVLSILLGLTLWQLLGSPDSLRSLWQGQPTAEEAKLNPTEQPKTGQASESQDPESDVDVKPESESPKPDSPEVSSPKDIVQPVPTDIDAAEAIPGKSEAVTDQPQPPVNPPTETPTEATNPQADANNVVQGLKFSESEHPKAGVFILRGDQPLQLVSKLNEPATDGRIVVPPSTRATLQFGQWQWTACGPCVTDVILSDNGAEMTTSMVRGLFSSTQPQSPLVIKTPLGAFTITASSPAVWLGIEVAFRPAIRGSLDEDGTFTPILIVVAGSDDADLKDALMRIRSDESGREVIIKRSGTGVAVLPGQDLVEFALQSPPRWYSARNIRLIDQEASADYLAAFEGGDEPVAAQIQKLTRSQRPEIAALAIQTSMLLGNWQPFASELLGSDRMRSYWTSTIDVAKQYAATDVSLLNDLQVQLESVYASEGGLLFDRFKGLRRDQQTSDGLLDLVKSLESDKLPIRVLSSYELTQLTGDNHGFLPHAPVRESIVQLKRQLSSGRIAIKPTGDPIWERIAVP